MDSNIVLPKENTAYLLLENFALAGNVADKTPCYPESSSWTDIDGGSTPYPCDAAGFVVANAGSQASNYWVATSVAHPSTFKLRGVVSLGASDNIRFILRASYAIAFGSTDMDYYQFRVKDNGSNLPLVKLQSRTYPGALVEVNDTDGNAEAVLGNTPCTTRMPFQMDGTDTQLIITIGGASRAWPLSLFPGNTIFGFACGGVTDKLHELRMWQG